jgi:quercetin dioxygenase-like cupin family protein
MMKGQSETDVERRTILLLGLAGASALMAGTSSRVLAQERKGVEIKVLREGPSMIPGFAKVQVRDAVFEPGGTTGAPTAMKNAMICQCTAGTLEVNQDGKTFTADTGYVWTCNVGTMEGSSNKGTTQAIMRIFDLLPS